MTTSSRNAFLNEVVFFDINCTQLVGLGLRIPNMQNIIIWMLFGPPKARNTDGKHCFPQTLDLLVKTSPNYDVRPVLESTEHGLCDGISLTQF